MEKLKWIEELEDGSFLLAGAGSLGKSKEEILQKVSEVILKEVVRNSLEEL